MVATAAQLFAFDLPALAYDNVPGVIPQPDAATHLMLQDFPDISPHSRPEQKEYFLRPVPRVIHQIGEDGRQKKALVGQRPWAAYAEQTGFSYKVWSLEDIEIDLFAGEPVVRQAMSVLLQEGRTDAAGQLMELAILAKEGGIYAGSGVQPPRLHGSPVDLAEVANLQGLTIATNLRARAVGNTSVYLAHAFMAVCAGHPWMQEIVRLAAKNVLQAQAAGNLYLPARYLCGNAFLSRNLFGFYNVLSFTYLQSLGMFPLETADGSEDALD